MTVHAIPRRTAADRFTTYPPIGVEGADPESDREYPAPPPVRPAPSMLASAAPTAQRAGRGVRAWFKRKGAQARQVALSVGGLGAFGVAGFEVSPVVGWCMVGLSLLLLEHQVKS